MAPRETRGQRLERIRAKKRQRRNKNTTVATRAHRWMNEKF